MILTLESFKLEIFPAGPLQKIMSLYYYFCFKRSWLYIGKKTSFLREMINEIFVEMSQVECSREKLWHFNDPEINQHHMA